MTILEKIPNGLPKNVVKFESCSCRLGAAVIVQFCTYDTSTSPLGLSFLGCYCVFLRFTRFEYVNHTILKSDCRVVKNESYGAVNLTFSKELSLFFLRCMV